MRTNQDFHPTLSAVREEITARLEDMRAELLEPDFFSSSFEAFASGVGYEATATGHAALTTLKGKPTRKYAHATVYRHGSGTYELTFYIL